MIAARNVTAGRQSRLAVYERLADAYQDSGMLCHLMSGNLDAPCSMPAGAQASADLVLDLRRKPRQLVVTRAGAV